MKKILQICIIIIIMSVCSLFHMRNGQQNLSHVRTFYNLLGAEIWGYASKINAFLILHTINNIKEEKEDKIKESTQDPTFKLCKTLNTHTL